MMPNALLILFVALLAVGCQSRRQPSASDTVLRSSYSDAYAADYDSANGDMVSGDAFAAQGLETRDASFGSLSDDNLEAGLLPSVYFDYARSTLNASEREKLTQAVDYLSNNFGKKILVEGHCDWRGTADYNLGLGERRARAVKNYLTQLGVAADRIGTVSKGDLEAITNGSDAQMSKDRRADILILKK